MTWPGDYTTSSEFLGDVSALLDCALVVGFFAVVALGIAALWWLTGKIVK